MGSSWWPRRMWRRPKQFLALPEVQVAMPRDVSLQWGSDLVGTGAQTYRRLYVLEDEAFLTGEMLENAVANRDPQYNQPLVNFQLNRRGGRRFADFTAPTSWMISWPSSWTVRS